MRTVSDSGPWWNTTDPVRIARVLLGGVVGALLLGVQFALVLQAEVLSPGPAIVSADALGGSLTAHALVLVFLFALPALSLVFGGLMLPSQVGARNLAFPGLNRVTLQVYFASWGLIALALLGGSMDRVLRGLPAIEGAISWTLASAALGLHALGLALVCLAINLLTTVLYERPDDLAASDLPVLVWGLVTGAAVQLVVGVAVAALGLLLFLEGLTTIDVLGSLAGDPFAYERLLNFVLHAGVAVVVLPALGIAFDVVSNCCRKPPAGGLSNPLALAALAILSLGGSGVALINDGASPALMAAHSGISLLAMVPATVLLYNLLATLVGAAIEVSAAFLHALNLMVLLTLGGLAGVFLATLSTGAYLQGSLFATAHLHYLLGGGATAGLITGLYVWWPRLMGRTPNEILGKTSAALLFAGFLLAFFPGLIAGSQGLSSLTLFSSQVAATLERVAAVGSILLCLGLVVAGWDFLGSLLRDANEFEATQADPSQADTTRDWRSTGEATSK